MLPEQFSCTDRPPKVMKSGCFQMQHIRRYAPSVRPCHGVTYYHRDPGRFRESQPGPDFASILKEFLMIRLEQTTDLAQGPHSASDIRPMKSFSVRQRSFLKLTP